VGEGVKDAGCGLSEGHAGLPFEYQFAQPALQSKCGFLNCAFLQIVLPKAPNGKAHSSERPPVHPVSASVPPQLWNPVALIRLGHVLVPRTRMVETAVRKNHKPQAWYQNIRLARQSPHIPINSPAAAESAAYARIEGGFRCGPATLDAGHNLAALCCRENVSHRAANVPET